MGIVVNKNQLWAVCRDCKIKRIVKRIEWTRRSPPRCTACGGLVEPAPSKDSMSNKIDSHMRDATTIRKRQRMKQREVNEDVSKPYESEY